MLKRLLSDVQRNPADHETVEACLQHLAEQKDTQQQAEGLATVSAALIRVHPLKALDVLEAAFLLEPKNDVVLEKFAAVLEACGDFNGKERVEVYRKSRVTKNVKLPVSSDGQFVEKGQTQIKGVAAPRIGSTSVRQISEMQGVVEPAGKSDSATTQFQTYRDFIKETGMNIRFLEYAVEFSDDLVGLVHFVHYLFFTKQLDEDAFKRVSSVLQSKVESGNKDIKAQVRFSELIEPHLENR